MIPININMPNPINIGDTEPIENVPVVISPSSETITL